MKKLNLILVTLIACSCSTLERSIGLGATLGGTAGALIGNSEGKGNHRDKSTLQGAAIGASLGALIGYAGYEGKKQKTETKSPQKEMGLEPKAPSLTAPKVRRVFVPSRIEGERYIEGHYMYVIEKTSTWSE